MINNNLQSPNLEDYFSNLTIDFSMNISLQFLVFYWCHLNIAFKNVICEISMQTSSFDTMLVQTLRRHCD